MVDNEGLKKAACDACDGWAETESEEWVPFWEGMVRVPTVGGGRRGKEGWNASVMGHTILEIIFCQ